MRTSRPGRGARCAARGAVRGRSDAHSETRAWRPMGSRMCSSRMNAARPPAGYLRVRESCGASSRPRSQRRFSCDEPVRRSRASGSARPGADPAIGLVTFIQDELVHRGRNGAHSRCGTGRRARARSLTLSTGRPDARASRPPARTRGLAARGAPGPSRPGARIRMITYDHRGSTDAMLRRRGSCGVVGPRQSSNCMPHDRAPMAVTGNGLGALVVTAEPAIREERDRPLLAGVP